MENISQNLFPQGNLEIIPYVSYGSWKSHIRVTYGWHTKTYEWRTDDIRVHGSNIRITYEYIRVIYGWNTSTCEWHTNGIRVHTSGICMTYRYMRVTCRRHAAQKGSGISFWCIFPAWLFHTNAPFLILYQLTKLQYHIFFPSQDIK